MTENIPPTPTLEESASAASLLLRTVMAQSEAERNAYQRGWADCTAAMAYTVLDAWEAGYAAAEAEMDELWVETARKVRALGSPDAHTSNERRAAELAACKSRAGDFPGLEADPDCLKPVQASIDTIARNHNRRAA